MRYKSLKTLHPYIFLFTNMSEKINRKINTCSCIKTIEWEYFCLYITKVLFHVKLNENSVRQILFLKHERFYHHWSIALKMWICIKTFSMSWTGSNTDVDEKIFDNVKINKTMYENCNILLNTDGSDSFPSKLN